MSGLSRRVFAVAALLVFHGSALFSQSQTGTVLSTLSLGEPDHAIKLENDDNTGEDIKFENGFFISKDKGDHVVVRDKDGHTTADLILNIPQKAIINNRDSKSIDI